MSDATPSTSSTAAPWEIPATSTTPRPYDDRAAKRGGWLVVLLDGAAGIAGCLVTLLLLRGCEGSLLPDGHPDALPDAAAVDVRPTPSPPAPNDRPAPPPEPVPLEAVDPPGGAQVPPTPVSDNDVPAIVACRTCPSQARWTTYAEVRRPGEEGYWGVVDGNWAYVHRENCRVVGWRVYRGEPPAPAEFVWYREPARR